MTRNQFRVVIAVVLAGGAMGFGAGSRLYGPQSVGPFEVGDKLPLTNVIHATDQSAKLQDALHTPLTVIALFSTKCGSCYGEAAVWHDLTKNQTNVEVLALAVTDDLREVARFSGTTGLPIRFARIDDATRVDLKGVAVPTIYVVDRDGDIKFSGAGSSATEALRISLEQLK